MSVSFRKLRSRLLDEKISMAKLMKMSGITDYAIRQISKIINTSYNWLITNEEVINELLKTAAQIAEQHKQGANLGLSEEGMLLLRHHQARSHQELPHE